MQINNWNNDTHIKQIDEIKKWTKPGLDTFPELRLQLFIYEMFFFTVLEIVCLDEEFFCDDLRSCLNPLDVCGSDFSCGFLDRYGDCYEYYAESRYDDTTCFFDNNRKEYSLILVA